MKTEVRRAIRYKQMKLVRVLNTIRRVVKLTVVTLPEEEATKLEELSHLNVEMMSCRVRRRVIDTRCFRCFEFGHQRRSCKREDWSSWYHKCGESGVHAKSCMGTQKCFLCINGDTTVDCGHGAGSGACAVFRRSFDARGVSHMQVSKEF